LFNSRSQSCKINGSMVAIAVATMNNVSFKPPMVTTKSMLEMHYYNTSDMCAFPVLPDRPPRAFNYTDKALVPRGPKLAQLEPTSKATVVRRFRHGATVDVVFQSTAMMAMDSNPMHLHGHNMFVLAQGNGNYNATRDVHRYNLVEPPVRNTVQVPGLGWTAIRFVADNTGM
jgi:laccase